MSVAKILRLDEYRDRRQHRLEIGRVLHGTDQSRGALANHLIDFARHSGADRVAAVWVDEYGPGLIHPYVVLDLLNDAPRRGFDIEPLRKAWEAGVPGSHEIVAANGHGMSCFAVALGSDGARAWFVLSDAVSPRPALSEEARAQLMFLAGECSAVALHRDLDAALSPDDGVTRFAGWPILRDLEGREDDDVEGRRMAQRFVVARVVRMLVDEDLVMPHDRLSDLVGAARRELCTDHGMHRRESELWQAVLSAIETGGAKGFAELSRLLIRLALGAEDGAHHHGAIELYDCAFQIATAYHDLPAAVDAARYRARLLRRGADHDEAMMWYETARELSVAAGLDDITAVILNGIATLLWERGKMKDARALMEQAFSMAAESGDAETIATLHRGMLIFEKRDGNTEVALMHGWSAVRASEKPHERMRSLASLASALKDVGDIEASRDAWSVVAASSEDVYLKMLALDALGHFCALEGDQEGFLRYSEACDLVKGRGLRSAQAQILYYRGLSYQALGRVDHARKWLTDAVEYAERHGFTELIFDSERALAGLDATEPVITPAPAIAAPAAVRDGVRAMREELAGAAY